MVTLEIQLMSLDYGRKVKDYEKAQAVTRAPCKLQLESPLTQNFTSLNVFYWI